MLSQKNTVAGDFTRPGHMVPLRARPGGTLTRKGHTEAALGMFLFSMAHVLPNIFKHCLYNAQTYVISPPSNLQDYYANW